MKIGERQNPSIYTNTGPTGSLDCTTRWIGLLEFWNIATIRQAAEPKTYQSGLPDLNCLTKARTYVYVFLTTAASDSYGTKR